MQPKAAKKIGGMTPKKIGGMAPKKMTGGDYGTEEEVKIAGFYTVTKKIDEAAKKMMICVETDMPSGSMQEPAAEESSDVPPAGPTPAGPTPAAAAAAAAAAPGEDEKNKFINPNQNSVNMDELDGGKKKRKSSKKRKSMKKKGGMKRKSMKVKA